MPETCHLFGLFLIHMHGFDPVDIEQALDVQRKGRTPIGQLALESHLLILKEIMEILKIQADFIADIDCPAQKFGEIAVAYGFLSEDNLQRLLKAQINQQTRLGEILIDAEILSPTQRDQLLSEFHQLTRGK